MINGVRKEVEDGNKPADSILDVYQLFDDSDYVVENYQPLYKGRYFFYDKQLNKILYVDEDGKVINETVAELCK